MLFKDTKLITSIHKLQNYSIENNFRGYDPYDALNSIKLQSMPSKTVKLLISQFLVYSPYNTRRLIGIKKGLNPKGIGLFLQALCKMDVKQVKIIKVLALWLLKNKSSNFSNYSWGYNFPWQSLYSYKEKNTPTIVNTSFIGHSLLDTYDLTGDETYLHFARSSCDFILEDIPRTKTDRGICFSYTPYETDLVFNASALGVSLLSRTYSYTKERLLKQTSESAANYLVDKQRPNGSWPYSQNITTGIYKEQLDWHQGFIIDSLLDFIKYCAPTTNKFKSSLMKGADFYKKFQFEENGKSLWRYPTKWPIDIHNQAQGIITFSKLGYINPRYREFAETIAEWTIDNMQDSKGFFYFQKWPFFTNQTSYIRWSQGWMLLALCTLLDKKINE